MQDDILQFLFVCSLNKNVVVMSVVYIEQKHIQIKNLNSDSFFNDHYTCTYSLNHYLTGQMKPASPAIIPYTKDSSPTAYCI